MLMKKNKTIDPISAIIKKIHKNFSNKCEGAKLKSVNKYIIRLKQ